MFKNVLADLGCDGIAAWDPGCLAWGGAMKVLLPRGSETVFKAGVSYASLDAERREMLDDYLQYRAADVNIASKLIPGRSRLRIQDNIDLKMLRTALMKHHLPARCS